MINVVCLYCCNGILYFKNYSEKKLLYFLICCKKVWAQLLGIANSPFTLLVAHSLLLLEVLKYICDIIYMYKHFKWDAFGFISLKTSIHSATKNVSTNSEGINSKGL